MARARIFGLLATLLVVVSSCVPLPPKASAKLPPTVIIYGDSVVFEAQAVLVRMVSAVKPGYRVIMRSAGGAAACDWFETMNTIDANVGARLVLLVFAGSYFTPCVKRTNFNAAWSVDLREASDVWVHRGVRVLLIGLPGMVGDSPTATSPPRRLASLDRATARERSSTRLVRFADVGSDFLDPKTHRYPAYLPCRREESAALGCGIPPAPPGHIQVRNNDTFHFCLQSYLSAACPQYSSGVLRLSIAIALAAARWPG